MSDVIRMYSLAHKSRVTPRPTEIAAARTKIHYTKPSITELERHYAGDAAANGWGERCFEYIDRFEQMFAQHLDVKHALATSSCTGALHMGFTALGLQPGDEVILADINWIASAAPITYLGAKPVFVDVLPNTWCIDPAKVEAAITSRTRAILAVHLYGNACDMEALMAIGRAHGLPVIEDAAEAIGARWRGRAMGSVGTFGVFSFHGTKTITTGEGGMFVTQDRELFERVQSLSNHGRPRGQIKQFWPEEVGFKYKMANVQAAIGCAQVERLDSLVARKRQIFQYYAEKLRGLPITMNPEPAGTTNGFWMPIVVVDKSTSFDRDALIADWKSRDIDGRVFFWPLSMLPMFEPRLNNTVSYDLYRRAVNLPSYHDLTEEQMDRVVAVLRAHLERPQ
jgi:perosamine synthetase